MIGLIDVDSTLPNLALMKISNYYKALGERVEFAQPDTKYDKVFASAIYTGSRPVCENLLNRYGSNIEIGGTGWDIQKRLSPEIEACGADYSLYTADMVAANIRGIMNTGARIRKAAQIADAGIGFTSRGCVRRCPFCFVPIKEGQLHQDQEIRDIINPRSGVIVLNDNNFTADPNCLDKLREIKERGLTVDINQGCDVRLINDEIAAALAGVRHLRSLHYAWDLMKHESQVLSGIKTLLKYIRPYRHMCFMLVGYNTEFDEDFYRFRVLDELKIDPYVMIYNPGCPQAEPPRGRTDNVRLKHFARWVNARIYTQCSFNEYLPWVKARKAQAAAY